VVAIEWRQWHYARRQRTWFKKEPWWQRHDAALGTDALLERVVAPGLFSDGAGM
jgi:tRNA A37 N6-isopentenylltransferase MiaA